MPPARLVLVLFLVAQFWDGVFTWVAVDIHGPAAEGNLILQTWMVVAGPVPTLLVAKLVAAVGGVILYLNGVHAVLAGLTAFYALGAIGPWLAHFGAL